MIFFSLGDEDKTEYIFIAEYHGAQIWCMQNNEERTLKDFENSAGHEVCLLRKVKKVDKA